MIWLSSVVAYLGLLVFVVAVIARILMWLKMPLHLRWELYPVAHEGKRAKYGGSYLEETDWWKKPRETSLLGELKVMVPEILFLVALKEHNPKLWLRSFPFHFGIYLVIGCTLLMMGEGLLAGLIPGLAGSTLVRWSVLVLGFGGLFLGSFGALGLLERRLADPALRDFTTPADLFNLIFFVVAFGAALAHAIVIDPTFGRVGGIVAGLVTLRPAALGTGAEAFFTGTTVTLLGLLVAYIPLTHMSHFVGKYFAYHAIRWNDAPNLRGGEQEKKIEEVLAYPVTWAGPHIRGGGKKTWGDLATEEMKK